MPSVQDPMREAVRAVQDWLAHTPNPGEAVVRQAIVLRVLHAAGFDIWNPAEVVPEETNGGGTRPDFLIRAGAGAFALELKGMKGSLKLGDYGQVAAYAGSIGMRWAMLTNGRVWIVLDEHLPGPYEKREVLKLELGQEGHTFADDLAALLDAGMWRADGFADAVQSIRGRQQRRLDDERIRREKTAAVQDIMTRFQIPTFELAADAAVKMNELTEAERDVLLGVPRGQTLRSTAGAALELPQAPTSTEAKSVAFVYELKGAKAHALYRPDDGSWTVQAGSTALNRLLNRDRGNTRGIEKRRTAMLENGELIVRNEQLLEYVRDVRYSSASLSAMDIAGASRNGWDVWLDDLGRPAQFHRPQRDTAQPG